jgi:hypothetical protein
MWSWDLDVALWIIEFAKSAKKDGESPDFALTFDNRWDVDGHKSKRDCCIFDCSITESGSGAS